MADEMKTRSIRADETTLDRFKAISEEFENQGECLSNLINAYELAKAKNTLTNMQTDISDYETHIAAIQRAFLHILELNENTELRCREEVRRLLESKDLVIEDLQKRLSDAESKQKIAELETETSKSEYANLLGELNEVKGSVKHLEETLSEHKGIIADKQIIIDTLSSKIEEAECIKREVDSKNQMISELTSKVDTLGKTIAQLENDIESYKSNEILAAKQAELDQKLAVTSVKETYSDKLEQLRNDKENLNDEIARLRERVRQLEQTAPTLDSKEIEYFKGSDTE